MPARLDDRRVRRSRVSRWLAALVAGSVVILVVEVVLQNPPRGAATTWPWNVHLLGVQGAVTLFVGVLGLALAQRHFANDARAYLTIESDWWHGAGWKVLLLNSGKGAAKILELSLEIGGTGAATPHRVSIEDLKQRLDAYGGFRDRVDYDITNFTRGAALAPGTTEPLAELGETVVAKIEHLCVVIRYESAGGDVYEKRASLLPYPGAAEPPPGAYAAPNTVR
jgi:hypothetical protein